MGGATGSSEAAFDLSALNTNGSFASAWTGSSSAKAVRRRPASDNSSVPANSTAPARMLGYFAPSWFLSVTYSIKPNIITKPMAWMCASTVGFARRRVAAS